MRAPIQALLGPDRLAVIGQRPAPIAWQDPDLAYRPRTIALTFDKGADAGLRADAEPVYGTFSADNAVTASGAPGRRHPRRAAAGGGSQADQR